MFLFQSRTAIQFASAQVLRVVFRFLVVLSLAGITQATLAQSCSVSNPSVVNVNFPAAISVPRDAPVGTLLSGWVQASAAENWNCSITNLSLITWLDLAVATSDRINSDGIGYALVKTNVDGVGIIVRFMETGINGGAVRTRQINVGSPGEFFLNRAQRASALGTRGTFHLAVTRTISLALIRSGSQAVGGQRMSAGLLGRSGVRFQPITTPNPDPSPPLKYTHEIRYSTVAFTESTCQASDVSFNMGSVSLSSFQGAGVRNGSWTQQNLNINNCPAGLNRISIILTTPPAGWLDSGNKVFKLNDSSDAATAKGIGIQLALGPSQTIAQYDTPIPVNNYGYNSFTGGSFTVPLSARYIKPASSSVIAAGRANASVIFTMQYQ